MKFILLFSLFSFIQSFSPLTIRRYSRDLAGQSIKVFEPKNIDKKNTHSLLFFTGGNSRITSEIYTNFLNKLASHNLSVYVAPSNLDLTEDLFDLISNEYLDVTNIGHSSGAVNALKSANKNKQVKKAVLLDPVDSDQLFNKFNFQNFIFSSTSQKPLSFKYIKDLLVVNAKKSYEWKLFPLTIPFIPAFKMNTDSITKDNVNINFIEADNFGHSDILNPFWGDIMHNTISKGSDDRNEEVIDKYHDWLADSIKNFVINNNIVSFEPDTLCPSDYETENIELE
jgi:pimeloyl-ACP methyl ester carboxylesterase